MSFFFHTGIKTKINLPNDLHVTEISFFPNLHRFSITPSNVLKMIRSRAPLLINGSRIEAVDEKGKGVPHTDVELNKLSVRKELGYDCGKLTA